MVLTFKKTGDKYQLVTADNCCSTLQVSVRDSDRDDKSNKIITSTFSFIIQPAENESLLATFLKLSKTLNNAIEDGPTRYIISVDGTEIYLSSQIRVNYNFKPDEKTITLSGGFTAV